jgi:hypothetical protein
MPWRVVVVMMTDEQSDKEERAKDATGLEKEITTLLDGHSVLVKCMAISLALTRILYCLDFDQAVEFAEGFKESIDKTIEFLGRKLN